MIRPAIDFPVKPTLMTMFMVVLPHLLVVLIVLLLVPVSWVIKLALVSLILLSCLFFLQLHVFQKLPYSVIRIQQDSVGNWMVTRVGKDNHAMPCELSSSSYISPLLIILNFKCDQFFPFYTALITPNSLAEQDLRRLRVRLKTMKRKKV